ncbi:PREDICTED: acyl-CoA desaturase-like [Cyphomyrmex costatus]|uniref:acyl-CoA desaturase-like n=1 Tax=Cyphomyrmex costatus TaxID=456900 RepID=UPI000852251E|nr:PREDICTED: acyl-CoA desaturase-like [Cyphomyrmex costatus]
MTPNILSTDSKILTKIDLQSEKFSITNNKMIDNENNIQNRDENYTKTEGWFKTELKWFNILDHSFLHLYLYACFTFNFFENLLTTTWIYCTFVIGGIGITAGAHRLWTHQTYKAKWQLIRAIFAVFYTSAGMNNIHEWVRNHRVHHKYTDPDADPCNSNRGFFFSYVGWLMMKKHPDVIRRGRQVDMSDVLTRSYCCIPNQPCLLADKMKEIFAKEPKVKIFCPSPMGEVRLIGLDESLNAKEIINAIVRSNGVEPGEVKVGRKIWARDCTVSTWIRCPLEAAIELADTGRIRIGWSSARAVLMDRRPPKCYRCLAAGHTRMFCPSEVDRTGACFNCGLVGHTTGEVQRGN